MMQCVVWGELYAGITYIMSVKETPKKKNQFLKKKCHNYILRRCWQTAQLPLNVTGGTGSKQDINGLKQPDFLYFLPIGLSRKKLKSIVSLATSDCKFLLSFAFCWVWSEVFLLSLVTTHNSHVRVSRTQPKCYNVTAASWELQPLEVSINTIYTHKKQYFSTWF